MHECFGSISTMLSDSALYFQWRSPFITKASCFIPKILTVKKVFILLCEILVYLCFSSKWACFLKILQMIQAYLENKGRSIQKGSETRPLSPQVAAFPSSFPRAQMTGHEKAELLNEIIAFSPFQTVSPGWIIVLFPFHSNELSAMDVIHSNRNTNRWVIDLHASLHWGSNGCRSHSVLYLPVWNPWAFTGRGQADFLQKVESLLLFSSPRAFLGEMDRIWQAELSRYKTTAGTPIGLWDIYRGHILMQEQDTKIFNLNLNRS